MFHNMYTRVYIGLTHSAKGGFKGLHRRVNKDYVGIPGVTSGSLCKLNVDLQIF